MLSYKNYYHDYDKSFRLTEYTRRFHWQSTHKSQPTPLKIKGEPQSVIRDSTRIAAMQVKGLY